MALANTMKLARFANGPLARYPLPQIYLLGEFFTMLLSIIIELVIRNMASLATTGFKQCLLNTPPTQVRGFSACGDTTVVLLLLQNIESGRNRNLHPDILTDLNKF